MMCQEVIELMQRYLDRDLEETEYRRMLLHLEACPDCTELFERLVNVSQELESLPKVLPPFSLVDAILPKLEQLEAQGMDASEKGPAAGSEPVRPAAVEPRHAPRPAPGSWRKNVREWISFPVFGGVVAAGLVFGFFLFGQGQPGGDADKLFSAMDSAKENSSAPQPAGAAAGPMHDEAKDSSVGGGAKAEPTPAAELTAPPQAQQEQPAAGANGGGAVQPPPQTEPPKAGKSAPAAGQPKDTPKPRQAEPPAAHEPAGGASAKAVVPGTGAASKSASPAGGQTQPDGTAPESGAAAPGTAQPPGEGTGAEAFRVTGADGDGNGTAAGEQEIVPPGPGEEAASKAPGEPSEKTSLVGASSLRSADPVHELAADDGSYRAVVAEGKVQVQDKDGKVVFTSMDWADADRIDLKKWAGGKLTYHVEMETGGQIRCFIVDVKAGTEAEAKKAP
ncbi:MULTISPECIES: zf-HC2 domain-containing protein [Paenibacillus]|uniref:zf-HC2 domain-containing protein n=1 Tax=Paenibacillus TaxID=44249 RepID=UPI0022B8F80D|nr:zf-HC2 domain-containing protein [Paenibacillus caseinilyticus]MCZ8518683.1 zf-HC2 domain-containing protein [Paenibacillus caseinilyticus]